ncbi:MAG: hypothetical protein ACREPM_20920 [Gemmatimonadaceae bacterium]
MPAGLVFQTITVLDETPKDWYAGPAISLSERSPVALPKHGISLRVNQELELAALRVRQMMQLRGGVLLTVSLQQRKTTKADERPDYKFNFVTVDRPGPVPSLVLRTQLTSRPRRGWASKGYKQIKIYLWATRA